MILDYFKSFKNDPLMLKENTMKQQKANYKCSFRSENAKTFAKDLKTIAESVRI